MQNQDRPGVNVLKKREPPMDDRGVFAVLNAVGAIVTDSHFVYASGKHGPTYINKDALYQHPLATDAIGSAIADQWREWGIEAVVGPEKGGIILAQTVAFHLSKPSNEVFAAYAEKNERVMLTANDADTYNSIGPTGVDLRAEGGALIHRKPGFVIKRGGDVLIRGRRVLVVEDIFNSGESAKQTVAAVKAANAIVIGVGGICNRGGVTPEVLGVDVFMPLLSLPLEQWTAEDCPQCVRGVSVRTDLGHGAAFLKQNVGV